MCKTNKHFWFNCFASCDHVVKLMKSTSILLPANARSCSGLIPEDIVAMTSSAILQNGCNPRMLAHVSMIRCGSRPVGSMMLLFLTKSEGDSICGADCCHGSPVGDFVTNMFLRSFTKSWISSRSFVATACSCPLTVGIAGDNRLDNALRNSEPVTSRLISRFLMMREGQ